MNTVRKLAFHGSEAQRRRFGRYVGLPRPFPPEPRPTTDFEFAQALYRLLTRDSQFLASVRMLRVTFVE
jgi:hypothetical protein